MVYSGLKGAEFDPFGSANRTVATPEASHDHLGCSGGKFVICDAYRECVNEAGN